MDVLLASYVDETFPSTSAAEDSTVCTQDEAPAASDANLDAVCIPSKSAAPLLDVFTPSKTKFHDASQRVVYTNPRIETLVAPLAGPAPPNLRGGLARSFQNHFSGNVEPFAMNEIAFQDQYHSFINRGIAEDPSDRPDVGKKKRLPPPGTEKIFANPTDADNPTPANDNLKLMIRKRAKNNDPSSPDYLGPWAPYEVSHERLEKLKLATEARDASRDIDPLAPSAPSEFEERSTTTFHGRFLKDYQGRSWVAPPRDLKKKTEDSISRLPKKQIHSYLGHTMGVQHIQFFPKTGHLLLSGSMDSTIKIWDVYNKRTCLRTYTGHHQAVREIAFVPDGSRFYSCSFDKNILLWDTEYGKIIGTFTNDKTPYCVSVHPEQPNVFIIGSSDKKAVQFDADSGKITQEYNEHLAAVNTVTFCDDNHKIVTTSDDKKMFVWEFGIPVVVKHIAEPHMHSMPAVTAHPNGKFLACQSMDNQIVVYEGTGRFRFQSKKRFKGHASSGYAIKPTFSPEGKYVVSGDVGGKMWIWDWKTTKAYRTLQAHDGVCIGAAWHPTISSRVATCGWDGVIQLFD